MSSLKKKIIYDRKLKKENVKRFSIIRLKIKKKFQKEMFLRFFLTFPLFFILFTFSNREERNIMIPEKKIFREDIGEELECNKSR